MRPAPHHSSVALILAGFLTLVVLPLPTVAQEAEDVDPVTEMEAEDARNAPLFQSHEPVRATLRTDIEWLRDERDDEEEVDGTFTYLADDGARHQVDVEVRTRGNFRREKRNCNFPPLRLDFPKGDVEGTLLAGQDKIKLVTPCHDSRGSYQDYVYYEYLAYRILNLHTPISFRVRLIEITYEDIEDDYDTRTKMGFLIESDEMLAARHMATVQEVERLHPAQADPEYAVLVSLYQYLIGNTDWSAYEFHNFELIQTVEGRNYPVPYDFDFSGLVDARYAVPAPELSIRDVRDRLFRGFCYPHVRQHQMWRELFNEKRPAVEELVMGFQHLEEDDREDTVGYFEDFYEVLNDERKYEREIINACRG